MEKWKIFALLSMVFAGFTSVIAKYGMKDLHSDVALFIRTFVVLVFVGINAFFFRNAFTAIQHTSAKNILFLTLSGITTSLSWIFYYRAMKEGDVSYVASIDKASIVITLILSFIILKEPVSAKVLAGAGLILAGMLVLVWK